jgi:hypothetical protein
MVLKPQVKISHTSYSLVCPVVVPMVINETRYDGIQILRFIWRTNQHLGNPGIIFQKPWQEISGLLAV